YKEGHRKIFDSMLALFDRNEPVDLLTISEELRRRSELDEVGGPATLGALVEYAATAAHLLSYGGIVREKAVLSDIIRIATEIIGRSYDGRDDVEKVLDDAERLIFQISERRMQGTAFPVRSILKGTFEQIEKLYDQKEHITGLATGFSGLDEKTSGFQSSDFIIIAGRPSMGKTAFAMNIAKYAGVRSQRRVLVLSLEMSQEQLVPRRLRLNVPVVALSQLSRAVESRQSKEPQLSDLRESGALEQDADLILFLYRPDRYGVQPAENEHLAQVIIGKQRNGPTGTINLTFIPEYASFENRAER